MNVACRPRIASLQRSALKPSTAAARPVARSHRLRVQVTETHRSTDRLTPRYRLRRMCTPGVIPWHEHQTGRVW